MVERRSLTLHDLPSEAIVPSFEYLVCGKVLHLNCNQQALREKDDVRYPE